MSNHQRATSKLSQLEVSAQEGCRSPRCWLAERVQDCEKSKSRRVRSRACSNVRAPRPLPARNEIESSRLRLLRTGHSFGARVRHTTHRRELHLLPYGLPPSQTTL